MKRWFSSALAVVVLIVAVSGWPAAARPAAASAALPIILARFFSSDTALASHDRFAGRRCGSQRRKYLAGSLVGWPRCDG